MSGCWSWSSVLLLSVLSSLAGGGSIFYASESGEVFLDVNQPGVERFAGFDMRSSAGRFLDANYRRLGGATDLFRVSNRNIVEGGALVGGYAAGLYHLGEIYPPGLSEVDVANDLSGVWAVLGETSTQPLDVISGRPTGIPLNVEGIQQVERWATDVTLSYYPHSGELIVSSDGDTGGHITLFRIDGDFNGNPAVNPNEDARFSHSHSHVELIGLTAPGSYSLGPILPPLLTPDELALALDRAVFASQLGVGVADIDVVARSAMQITFVPEPDLAIAVLAVQLACCLVRRHPRLSSACS